MIAKQLSQLSVLTGDSMESVGVHLDKKSMSYDLTLCVCQQGRSI